MSDNVFLLLLVCLLMICLYSLSACNVLYINSVDMESLTGRQAVSKAITDGMGIDSAKCTVVHFKVSSQGITLTDNKRK